MLESDHTPSPCDDTVKKFRVQILQRNRLIKNVTGLSTENFDEMTFAQLEVKLELLEQKFKTFESVQSLLEHTDESQFEEDHRDKFEDAYCVAKSKIMNKLSLQKTMPLSSTQIIQHESTSRPKVNLPKLQLPTFNGNQSEWLDFYNMFSVLVDKNSDISNVEKFQYLRSCLEGDAAKLIQSLEVTVFNYSKALDLLRSRYDNKRYIFNSHLQEIFRIQNMLSPSTVQLRNFVDNINANLRALQSFTSKLQISDGIILHLIVSKLDSETTTKWEEEVSNNAKQDRTNSFYLPTWDELSTFLERRCQTFDIIATNNVSFKINQQVRKQTSFVVSGNQFCNLCDQPDIHSPFKCIPFLQLDPIGRYELIKRKSLCLNCLQPNHISNNCPSNNRCQHCRVSHHTLLHREIQIASTQENADSDDLVEQRNAPTL